MQSRLENNKVNSNKAAQCSQQADVKEISNDGGNISSPSSAPTATKHTSPAQASKSDTYQGPEIPFAELCEVFEAIEATTKRLTISEYLTTFFKKLMNESPGNLLPTTYLCLNKVGPDFEGLELGLGEALLMKAIAESTGRTLAKVKADVGQLGDLGKVAAASRTTQAMMFKPKPLTVASVFKALRDIATTSGANSIQKKVDRIKSLLMACSSSESKFLVRMLEGKLRIGLAQQSILSCLAQGSLLHWKEKKHSDYEDADIADATAILKAVFNEVPSYDIIIPVLLEFGVLAMRDHCKMTPGIPLKPMLAHPTKSITQVLDRFTDIPFTCEYKYDGERGQLHMTDEGKIMIFSRNGENMSEKYPDIMEKVTRFISPAVTSFVMDTEIVACDGKTGNILPFQILSTRKRKDVITKDIEVHVRLFAFDLLYLNGNSLIQETLKERRNTLYNYFVPVVGEFDFAKHMDSTAIEDIEAFLEESVKNNCEGLMVKTLEQDSSYEPSKRSRNWLKVKKDYLEGVGDSLDLVVIGAYIGRGKRTGGYGGYLLACYNEETEEFQAICKIGTGFSDEDLATQYNYFKDKVIPLPKSYYSVTDAIKPDVWFDPTQVWEVKVADFSISPIYTAGKGMVDPSKGISLRFPRFLKIREDKTPEQATDAAQIAEMYRQQSSINNVLIDDDEY